MSSSDLRSKKGDDLHFKNGHIWDSNKMNFRRGELVLNDGRIVQIDFHGRSNLHPGRDAEVFDLEGGYLSPAFIDGHMHLLQWSISRSGVDLSRCRSIKEVRSTIGKVVDGKEGNKLYQMTGTVFGTDLDDSMFPSSPVLDSMFLEGELGEFPIIIRRVCGHKAVANSRGIEELGLDEGQHVKGVIFEDRAMNIPWQLPMEDEALHGLFMDAVNELHRMGVVGGVDIIPLSQYDRLMDIYKNIGLELRSSISIVRDRPVNSSMKKEILESEDEAHLPRPCFEKFFLDGSIGARTASFERDYLDAPMFPLMHSDKELKALALRSYEDGLVPMVHCIGDAAISQAIRVFEGIGRSYRLEHAEAMTDDHLEGMKGGNGGLCLQPNFQHIWGRKGGLYESALGSSAGLNRLRSIIRSGVPWCFGTDMMPPSVLFAFKGGLEHPVPAQRLDLSEVVEGFSFRSRRSSKIRSKNDSGMEIGSCPDLTVFDRELASVSATMMEGRLVYRKDHFDN